MDEQKALGALGLSRRAGKCIAGDYAVERAVKAKRTYLVLVDSSASEATRERYRALCENCAVACMVLAHVGKAMGKPEGKIAAITDQGFADMIIKAAQ